MIQAFAGVVSFSILQVGRNGQAEVTVNLSASHTPCAGKTYKA